MEDKRISASNDTNFDKSSWLRKFTIVEWLLAILFIAFIVLYFVLLGKKDLMSSEHWPGLGDFIGGILGTIVAYVGVKLLVKTLQSQEKANKENARSYDRASDVYDLQQFNEMFKLLFAEYQKSIQSYKIDNHDAGRSSMHEIVVGLRKAGIQGIEPGYYEHLSEQALEIFNNYYVVNHTVASMQFRILYRIFCLIENAHISERRKTDIIKILRCQLSEDELILIRYNAMSSHGENMRRYINRYNILKHLPIMTLLEFSRPCSVELSETSRNCITTEFNRWRSDICKCFALQLNEDKHFEYLYTERYKAKITIQKDKKLFKFELTKFNNRNKIGKESSLNVVLDKFEVKELKDFLLNIFLDFFEYSNFKMLNNGELKESSDIISSTTNSSDTVKIELERENYQIRCKSNNDDGPR